MSRYSTLKHGLASLFGIFCIVCFAGVTWRIDTPTMGESIPKASNIGGTGVGPAQTNFLFKFKYQGEYPQTIAGTSEVQTPPPAPTGEGNWNATLEPPAGQPYSGLWPVGGTVVEIWEGSTYKTTQGIVITP